MKVIHTVVKELQQCVDVLCDKCGNSTKEQLMSDDNHLQTEHAVLRYDAGYGSRLDEDSWELHLCENCFIDVHEFITGQRIDPFDDNKNLTGYIRSQWDH